MNHASEMEKAWRPGPIFVDELGPSSKGDINVHAKDFAVGPRLEGGCESCSVSGLWDQGPACPMSAKVKKPNTSEQKPASPLGSCGPPISQVSMQTSPDLHTGEVPLLAEDLEGCIPNPARACLDPMEAQCSLV